MIAVSLREFFHQAYQELSVTDPNDGHLVQLSGPVTLYESNEIRETLLTAVKEELPLKIDLGTTGPWDLAGLQLLIATVSTCAKKGLAVSFDEVPKSCAEIAERAGLSDWLIKHSTSFLGLQSQDTT